MAVALAAIDDVGTADLCAAGVQSIFALSLVFTLKEQAADLLRSNPHTKSSSPTSFLISSENLESAKQYS
jgi:hypothetical protein